MFDALARMLHGVHCTAAASDSQCSKWCLFERRRAKCKQLETRQTRIQMKNQMHKTISQSAVFVICECVCGCPCVWASLNFFFLLSTFRLFKLDTLNDLMRFENLTQYDAVCALTFCYSFSSFFIDHKRERETVQTNKQTMHTIEMLTRLLSADILVVCPWKETESCVCISFDSQYHKIQINKKYPRRYRYMAIFHTEQIFKVDNCSFDSIEEINLHTDQFNGMRRKKIDNKLTNRKCEFSMKYKQRKGRETNKNRTETEPCNS